MSKFVVNATGFSPIERESIKRSIIAQGMKQRVKIRVITVDGQLEVTASGEPTRVLAYEVAILHWFGQRGNVKP